MSYGQVCAHKFALYLYNNNHLDNFTIEKADARQLYNNEFKTICKPKLGFSTVFFCTLSMLRRQENLNLMIFKKNKLIKLKKQESNIDTMFKKGVSVKKKTLVSHSVSFNNSQESKEKLVSQEECKICDIQFENEQTYKDHLKNLKHTFMEDFNKALKRPGKRSDLQFVISDGSPPDSILVRKEVPKTINLQIKNTSKQSLTISSIKFKSEIKEVTFNPSYPVDLGPLKSTEYTLTVCSMNDGIIYYPILFSAGNNNNTEGYSLEMVFHVHDEFFDDLHPTEPYVRSSKAVLKEYIENIDSGERPNIFPKIPLKVPLRQYSLPIDLALVLNAGLKPFDGMTSAQKAQLATLKNLLNVKDKQNCLQPNNYTKLLDMLLYIEEHQMYKDIRDYDREDQELKKTEGGLLELQVPGLAEHRPSVIFADPVFVREHKTSGTLYEGFVHKVKESSVLLKFSKNFMDKIYIKGKKFYVNFTFNRYPLKVEHQALEFIKLDNIAHLLFPVKITHKPAFDSELMWFNRDINNNREQQQAVRCILNRTAMPAPYLVFGPPGTGKTMTIVESVKQIHKLTNHKILICTPSNNAANEIVKRLTSISTIDMFRYIAPSFPISSIPEEIKKYTNYRNSNYYQPIISEFLKYRILITTLCSAAKLINNGCPQGHFGYVFIDESGQATETETLIPIAHILTGGSKKGVISGQIVLAGDPMQLGPVIHSTLAKEYGFGISMLERLMSTCQPYKKDNSNKYCSSALTKLIKNYRSHSVIIKEPNKLFYDDELETAGDHLINVALNWEHLPNRQFPLIFHNVSGIDQREKNSPSFFNVQEIQVIMQYLDKLIGCKMRGITIKEEHIGIISPYKKQVDKIKQACKKKRYNDKLMIGSVEQIQGQERLIIIISTVRSRPDFLKFDNKFHLGFLANPKRFNVAITRAKALLIVTGNPNILQHDKHWRSLISYCKENKSLIGDKFDFVKDEKVEKLINDVQCMSLQDPEDCPGFVRGDL